MVVAHEHAALRIEPGLGLVEEQDLRLVHQAERDVQTALHAAGQRLAETVRLLRETEDLEQVLGARAGRAAWLVVEAGHELELLEAGQRLPDHEVLWRRRRSPGGRATARARAACR